MSRFEAVKGALRVARTMLGAAVRYRRTIAGLVAGNARRCAELREAIASAATPADLAALWRSDLHDLLHTDCRTFDTGARQGGPGTLHAKVRALVGERDAATLVTGLHDDDTGLDSLGPVLGLARVRRGELDRAEYARLWGHRCADEFELSAPRPAEDPAWLDRELAHADGDPDELLRAQRQARERAWARHPHLRAKLAAPLAKAAAAARERERARSEVVRCFGVLRAFWLRAGELTGHGDDVFFLPEAELVRVLDGDQGPVAAIPGRRVAYERYRALPPYPPVIRGRFDPVSWAAQRSAPAGGTAEVTGFPGAAGVVEGTVRVLSTVEEGAALEPGEVLVTTVTNIGWTPLFPRAAAVVTDIGAPLSHAAVVARELGVPAVVGCGDAVARLRTGTRVRVDGAAGTVTVLGARAGIVVAGGAGRRLGGVDKPALVVGGRTLLEPRAGRARRGADCRRRT
ncbi:PEP-utilizing enzyme [Actinokineospora sp. G85]|uniref:PEP-utilizing enzyme n=1 Tax=Actinokineospora sp. G85 TaxID=3406626 RepID=UPI003C763686